MWYKAVHKSGFERIRKKNTNDPCVVCMWYRGIRQSGLEQDTEIQINGKWYPILTWANYRNTNTENLCAYGIHSRLGQNTEIQIRKIPQDMASNVTAVWMRIEMCRGFFVKANLTFCWPNNSSN